ncbi:nuclear transport factor 2 family protein [Flavobacteriaceae bacterium S356]|uniref:Nuclear transport factor 2 family protein n=1 Tax=Asprobacillus argus TaxID=3076534 RepID=A0ABU3LH84_9FLAO|nr:nuclear transport factor 2 family protein [Flavobacteriaceae bacterium S356]
MKKTVVFLSIILPSFICCNFNPSDKQLLEWKTEIAQTEKEFNDLAQKEGLAKAFETYAATNGVINRRRKIIQGKKAIGQWYLENPRPDQTLTWKPDFVDVSKSGDLGYTYGTAVFTTIDSAGTKKERKGKFHTVWKRQPNGDWRFVWD